MNLGLLIEEITSKDKAKLGEYQNSVEHGSALERYILEALDRIEKKSLS